MKRLAFLILLLPLAALAACGGETSPEDDVTEVANQILEAKSPEQVKVVCQELITPGMLRSVYGGELARCEDQPLNDDSGIEDPGEVGVASVSVEGEKADAAIVTTGGSTDGNDGTWYFRKTGGDWKLDRIGDDFLRTSFAISIRNVDQGVVSYEPMRKCMGREVQQLPASQIRGFMYKTMRGDRQAALDSVLKIAGACPRPMAEFVANELATRVLAKKEVTPAQIRCAKKKLVPLLQVTDLSSIALGSGDYGDATGLALAGLIAGVMKQCPA